jgi:hypothetical protein
LSNAHHSACAEISWVAAGMRRSWIAHTIRSENADISVPECGDKLYRGATTPHMRYIRCGETEMYLSTKGLDGAVASLQSKSACVILFHG